jgi:hypothetical protein
VPPGRPSALLAVPFVALLGAPLHAATVRVPTDQPTVRAAANAAADGDTVLIAPGIHGGGVYLSGKRLTFASWFVTTQDTSFISQTVLDSIAGDPCGGSTSCAGNAVLEFAGDAGGSAVIGLTLRRGEDGVRSRASVDIAWCHIVANADGVDYQNNSGGTFHDNLFANNSDDGIDINGAVNVTVRDNVIRNNHQDGVEFRLYSYAGPMTHIDFVRNRFIDNGGDGIQLIDYPDASDRTIRIEHNYFAGTFDAAVGCMPDGMTSETFEGAPIAERIYLVGNTFAGNHYGFVGGANVIALNNIFAGTQASALRRTGGSSIASYNLFWNNGIDHEESVIDPAHLLNADPLLDATGRPTNGSPAIDAGTALFQWQGQTVLDLPPSAYVGSAPDLGAYEFGVTPGANAAPVVNAGPDQTVTLPGAAALDGTVTDDGLPTPPTLAAQWSVVSGPGPVGFGNADAIDTQATFTATGIYVLRLTAGDGALNASDDVQITVQTPPAGSGTFERRIATGSDDAEQSAAGSMDLGSSDLEMTFDGSNQTLGLRFTNVTLAPGATITAAWVQFEADEAQSDPTTLLIQGQAADNPATFTSAATNISSRPRTAASAGWSPVAWTLVSEAGLKQRTPDLRSVIQEIVSRPGWASGNALAVIITGTGHRTARAFEGKAAGAALLHVEYGGGGPPPPPPANTAPVVDAGLDQTITLPGEAILDGTVTDDGLPGPPPSLTTFWTGSGPGPVAFLNASAVDTRASFTTAGSYVLRLTANDGALSTLDSLRVTVQPAPPPGPGTVERRIAAGSDDAEESGAAKMSTNNSDIELVFDRTNQRVGLRFTALAIPPGATVTRAYIQFTADETQNEATSLLIQGQAADNPGTFTTATGNVSSRPRTTASATWTPPAWVRTGDAGVDQRTPELSGVIQEIVSRPGWASGNALAIIITGTGHRTAESFEGKAAAAALLHVEYTVGLAPAMAAAEGPAPGPDPGTAPAPVVTFEAPPVELALHALIPNPTHGPLRIELSLPTAGHATLELVDVAGRRVVSRDLNALGAGRHVVDLRESLPAGVYLVRLIQGNRARVMKAAVIR